MSETESTPAPGWDRVAWAAFNSLDDEEAAAALVDFADAVVKVGNSRSHLHAAASRIRTMAAEHDRLRQEKADLLAAEERWLDPLPDPENLQAIREWVVERRETTRAAIERAETKT